VKRKLTFRASFALALALVAISTLGLGRLASAPSHRKVTEKEFFVVHSAKPAAKPGAVTIHVKNAGLKGR
jgi:hypothetical protein